MHRKDYLENLHWFEKLVFSLLKLQIKRHGSTYPFWLKSYPFYKSDYTLTRTHTHTYTYSHILISILAVLRHVYPSIEKEST